MTPNGSAVGYSGDWGAADALLAGCDAWYTVVAGLLPAPVLALTRAAQAGDASEAMRVNDAFRPLWEPFRTFRSFRVVYAMADLLGLARIEPPRPVLPLSQEVHSRVKGALQNLKSVGRFIP